MKISDIKTALQNRLLEITGFSGRVYVDRERLFSMNDYPHLEIVFESADPNRNTDHFITWRARLLLVVKVAAAENTRPDTAAEALLGEVQASLYQFLTLGGVVSEEIEFGPIRSEEEAGGERVVRHLSMELSVQYTDTMYGVATDEFGQAAFGFDMASPRNDPQEPTTPDGQIDAAVTITLPQ